MRAKPAKKARGKSVKPAKQTADSTVIKSLYLGNFLSFGPDSKPVPLGPLNVLIGRNGSGKSNFLHALGILQAIPSDISVYLRSGNTIREWYWNFGAKWGSDSVPPRFAIEATINCKALGISRSDARYTLTISDLDFVPEIYREHLVTEDGLEDHDAAHLKHLGGDAERRRLRTISILSRSQSFKNEPLLQELSNAFDSIALLREFTFGSRSPVRQPQRADMRRDRLLEDLSNLGLILNNLRQSPVAKQRFLEELNRLYDGISDFDVKVFEGSVQITVQEGDVTFQATRLSDGTLRYLAMLAVLCAPKPPPIICIEEPELGLHPDILHSIARLLVDASQRSQVIVTTHSEILVDALNDHPEAILVCDKEQGQTAITRLDSRRLKVWLKNYRLGDLWLSGEIGGTRW